MPQKEVGNYNSNFHHGNMGLERIALSDGFITDDGVQTVMMAILILNWRKKLNPETMSLSQHQ